MPLPEKPQRKQRKLTFKAAKAVVFSTRDEKILQSRLVPDKFCVNLSVVLILSDEGNALYDIQTWIWIWL